MAYGAQTKYRGIVMINKKMEKAINKQVNAELYSAYLYLSMSAYFESINLAGFANWMNIQAQEELAHAMKFYDYLIERGGRVTLLPIDAPQTTWASPLAAFKDVYEHEQKVTGLIHNLMDLALAEKDHASVSILRWFVDEQVEEESSADAIVEKLKLVGEKGRGIFMLDQQLGQRVFTPPTATEN
jgi:ferritin